MNSKFARRCTGALLTLTLAAAQTFAAPLGERPSYLAGEVSPVPNQQAITTTLWAPGLDEGFVPQGLTILDDTVLIASYRSTDTAVDRGLCRVFSVSMSTGKSNGFFDIPEDCGHAGGLVMLDKSTLVIADTHVLFKVDLARALAAKSAIPAIIATVRLKEPLKGSFVDFDGKNLWIGASEKPPAEAKAYKLSPDVFSGSKGKERVGLEKALSSIPIPNLANGMAFDSKGDMWISASNSKLGRLYKIDPASGKVLLQHDTVIGIEDLGFDREDNLWAVSEAGSRRWSKWSQRYPVIFKIKPQMLK
jgi:DNA-binding beta-propeller fold protein YncE